MFVIINFKLYRKDKWQFINSIKNCYLNEFIYYTETLFKTKASKYIVKFDYQLNYDWFKDEINSGKLRKIDFLLKTQYKIISYKEANEWVKMVLCW